MSPSLILHSGNGTATHVNSVIDEIDEEYIAAMKLQIFNDMELMKKELIKEMQRHGEEITNYVDKRSDETKLVAAQVIELT